MGCLRESWLIDSNGSSQLAILVCFFKAATNKGVRTKKSLDCVLQGLSSPCVRKFLQHKFPGKFIVRTLLKSYFSAPLVILLPLWYFKFLVATVARTFHLKLFKIHSRRPFLFSQAAHIFVCSKMLSDLAQMLYYVLNKGLDILLETYAQF